MASNHALSLQGFQPGRQSIGRNAGQRVLEVLEASRPLQKEISQYEDRPPFTDDIQRPSYRAALLLIGLRHAATIAALTIVPQVDMVGLVTIK